MSIKKIEDSGLIGEIFSLYQKGYSCQKINQWLKSKGVETNPKSIESIIEKYDSNSVKTNKENRKFTVSVEINTEEIFTRYDINEPSTPDEIMGATQELAARAMLLQQAILIGKLEAHARGECLYPEEDLKGIAAIGLSYQQLWGYPLRVNSSAALQTLQSQGFTVEGHEIDTDLFDVELKSAGLNGLDELEGSE